MKSASFILLPMILVTILTGCDGSSGGESIGSGNGNQPNSGGKNQTGSITLTDAEKLQLVNTNGLGAEQVLTAISDIVAERKAKGEQHSLDEVQKALDSTFTINCRRDNSGVSDLTCNIQEREKPNDSK